MEHTINHGTDASVDERFELETLIRPDGMVMTCRDCAGTVTFWNPTAERVRWYTGSHRCGGAGWQEAIPVDFSDDDPIPFALVDAGVAR